MHNTDKQTKNINFIEIYSLPDKFCDLIFFCHNVNLRFGASILHRNGGLHNLWDGLAGCFFFAFTSLRLADSW